MAPSAPGLFSQTTIKSKDILKNMKIILDDDLTNRLTPNNFTRFTTGFDLLRYMKDHPLTHIEEITFDNDLGLGLPEGYDVVKTMVNDQWHVDNINLHSANIIAVNNMISYILSAKKVNVFSYKKLSKRSLTNYSLSLEKR